MFKILVATFLALISVSTFAKNTCDIEGSRPSTSPSGYGRSLYFTFGVDQKPVSQEWDHIGSVTADTESPTDLLDYLTKRFGRLTSQTHCHIKPVPCSIVRVETCYQRTSTPDYHGMGQYLCETGFSISLNGVASFGFIDPAVSTGEGDPSGQTTVGYWWGRSDYVLESYIRRGANGTFVSSEPPNVDFYRDEANKVLQALRAHGFCH